MKGEGEGDGTVEPVPLDEPPTGPEPGPAPALDPAPGFEPEDPTPPDGTGTPVPLGAICRVLEPVGKGAALVL